MLKKPILFLILPLILIFTAVLIFLNNSLTGHLFRWGISLDLSGFKLEHFTQDKTRFSSVERLEATSGTTTIKIDRTKISDHNKYIEDRKFLFNSLFLPTTSPYPEVITNIIECPNEFKPKERAVGNGFVYTLFAGERFNYGVCSRDLVKYNSEYGIFDCKDKGIFEIRVFSKDRERIKQIVESFKC